MMRTICLLLPRMLMLMLLLTGCGYHLVGHGGSLPGIATQTIVVHADNALGQRAVSAMIQQLGNDSQHDFVSESAQADKQSQLVVHQMEETLNTQGFDSNGVANQYQLVLHGELLLQPPATATTPAATDNNGDPTWRSGDISVHGEIYASGGPAVIEANRNQVRKELLTQWAELATSRLRSGF
ncbi:MAG: hypothetical protein Q9M26_07035 [Mariprofundales bacterium]|nr:hypothetical protein [Mariprofundales bacterium]